MRVTLAEYLSLKNKKKAKRKDNAKFIAKMAGKKLAPSRSREVKKTDQVFSIFIRLRGKKRTGGLCELCLKRPIEVCFHWVSRKSYATRWLPENACASCRGCNYNETFNKQKYRDIFIERYGIAERERLESLARSGEQIPTLSIIVIRKELLWFIENGVFTVNEQTKSAKQTGH